MTEELDYASRPQGCVSAVTTNIINTKLRFTGLKSTAGKFKAKCLLIQKCSTCIILVGVYGISMLDIGQWSTSLEYAAHSHFAFAGAIVINYFPRVCSSN